MTLLWDSMESCTLIDKTTQNDVYGSVVTSYVRGATFTASVSFESSVQARVAMSQGVKNMYNVVYPKNIGIILMTGDIFERDEDGKTFRVSSDSIDSDAPSAASPIMQVRHCSAEEWSVPGEIVTPVSATEGSNV